MRTDGTHATENMVMLGLEGCELMSMGKPQQTNKQTTHSIFL